MSESGPALDIITWCDGPESDEVSLASNLIRWLSPSGASVCDPFMGKGWIGRAVLETGRTYIGIEKETTRFLSAMNTLKEQ